MLEFFSFPDIIIIIIITIIIIIIIITSRWLFLKHREKIVFVWSAEEYCRYFYFAYNIKTFPAFHLSAYEH